MHELKSLSRMHFLALDVALLLVVLNYHVARTNPWTPPPPLLGLDPGTTIMYMQQQQQGVRPQFVQKPSIRQAGGKIILECQLVASPAPAVTWLLNNQVIASGGRVLTDMMSDGQNHRIWLEISNVTLQDGGEYKALAKNPLGDATATITLNFEGEGSSRLAQGR